MVLNPVIFQKLQLMPNKYGESIFSDGRFKVLIFHELSDRSFLRNCRLLDIAITEMNAYDRIKSELATDVAYVRNLLDNLILELTSDYGIQFELAQEMLQYIASIVGFTGYETTDATFVSALRFDEDDNNLFSYINDGSEMPRLITSLLAHTTGNSPSIVAAENFLLLSFAEYLYSEAPIDDQNMFMFMELLNAGITNMDSSDFKTGLDRLFDMLEEKNPLHNSLRHYGDYKTAAGSNINFVIQSCIVRLKHFDIRTQLFQNYSKTEIDINRLAMTILSNTRWLEKRKQSANVYSAEMLLLRSVLTYIAQKLPWQKCNFAEIFTLINNLDTVENCVKDNTATAIATVYAEYSNLPPDLKSEAMTSMKKRNFYRDFK
jgi:hypothetical protein